jgi:hypothetical protein
MEGTLSAWDLFPDKCIYSLLTQSTAELFQNSQNWSCEPRISTCELPEGGGGAESTSCLSG